MIEAGRTSRQAKQHRVNHCIRRAPPCYLVALVHLPVVGCTHSHHGTRHRLPFISVPGHMRPHLCNRSLSTLVPFSHHLLIFP
ncbi:hypothetical protein PAXRUDRAFT_204422 [Paxillus rubicundulus Ve08.2h10]|uniref:Uncharacterized protein n=1 Tax=Paxillus rubicundulus Ve08.2h10 TaxID=930991 RepID=A0A0D0EBH4_9AGAM|nr:hypothetical protein PAXRUDRAFT_204422 [Paxillus rubicundulus Ve08.2h10]